MNFSSQKGQPDPEPLLSKMDTGTLREILEEVISVEELESHYTEPLLLIDDLPKKLQKKTTYTQQLNDPRWKTKRDKILKRDKYACRRCDFTDNLHVHHNYYKGLAWEVPDSALVTLCAKCHFALHTGKLVNSQNILVKGGNMNVDIKLSESLVESVVNEHIANVVFNTQKHWNKTLTDEIRNIVKEAIIKTVTREDILNIVKNMADKIANEILANELGKLVVKEVKIKVKEELAKTFPADYIND